MRAPDSPPTAQRAPILRGRRWRRRWPNLRLRADVPSQPRGPPGARVAHLRPRREDVLIPEVRGDPRHPCEHADRFRATARPGEGKGDHRELSEPAGLRREGQINPLRQRFEDGVRARICRGLAERSGDVVARVGEVSLAKRRLGDLEIELERLCLRGAGTMTRTAGLNHDPQPTRRPDGAPYRLTLSAGESRSSFTSSSTARAEGGVGPGDPHAPDVSRDLQRARRHSKGVTRAGGPAALSTPDTLPPRSAAPTLVCARPCA
jgi:hypothetical protein